MEGIGKMLDKKSIRKLALLARNGLGEAERKRGTLLLTERILGHQWFYGAEELLCFVSYGSEIGTGEIIAEALRLGKRVYVPKVLSGEDGRMEFYRIEALSQLKPGYRGIPEPSGESERYLYTPEGAGRTLMLMPGAAFDGRKNRVGYGRGFYDRYLADKRELQQRTIAVGFRCQLVERIPAEDTDIRPCQVICV